MRHASFQGANASQLEKEIGSEQFPANEHYFGLVNVSLHWAEISFNQWVFQILLIIELENKKI